MGEVTVKLSRRYEAHGTTFDAIVLREPKWRDYVAIGEIFERQPAGEGVAIITHYDRLEQYAARMVVSPAAPGALADLDMVDTYRIEEVIAGFFSRARRLPAPPTSSSGAPENRSPT